MTEHADLSSIRAAVQAATVAAMERHHQQMGQNRTPSQAAVPVDPTVFRVAVLEKQNDQQEVVLDAHEKQLHKGQLEFLDIRKDVQHLTGAVSQMAAQLSSMATQMSGMATVVQSLSQSVNTHLQSKTATVEKERTPFQKAGDALIFWGAPIIVGAIIWAIAKSGQIPGIAGGAH